MRPALGRSDRLKMVECRDLPMKCYSPDVLQSGQDDYEVLSAGILVRQVLPLAPELNHVRNLFCQFA